MDIIGTSCYAHAKSGNCVSITGDGGNAWGYYGNAYKKLAPKLYLWQYYDTNPDGLSEEDLIEWYIKEYYNLRLKEENPYILIQTLKEKFGDEIILLCHELPGLTLNKQTFCHRRVIADWIELETGITIPEIIITEDGKKSTQNTYDLKPLLKYVMKR